MIYGEDWLVNRLGTTCYAAVAPLNLRYRESPSPKAHTVTSRS